MKHTYKLDIKWTGANKVGTVGYGAYSRDHVIIGPHKKTLEASSDPHFRGDERKFNPEELFLASLSSCHMLWYLHLCADSGIIVLSYTDYPIGTMEEGLEIKGRFTEVILQPEVVISDQANMQLAKSLHQKAHEKCFIANSCNFPVMHRPNIRLK